MQYINDPSSFFENPKGTKLGETKLTLLVTGRIQGLGSELAKFLQRRVVL